MAMHEREASHFGAPVNGTHRLRNRVRDLRNRLRLRQSDLARECGVTRQTILAIEKDRLNPSIVLSLKIARVLREPVDYIFYLETVPEEGGQVREAVGQGWRPPAGNK